MKVYSKMDVIYLLAIPLLVSLAIASVFYPGAMSYDTLHALYSARNGVTESTWPPMVSYIWRVVDMVSTNPSLMHFSQIYLLVISLYSILFIYTRSVIFSSVYLLFFLSIPAVLGTLAVIWKDVLMAALFLAGFSITLHMKNVTDRRLFLILFAVAISLIFLGVCTRHNAITGAVPLIFFLVWTSCRVLPVNTRHLKLCVILAGSLLVAVVFFTKTLLDSYSLPGFVKMPTSTRAFIESVRVMDVAGASICVGENLFGDEESGMTLEQLRDAYDPRHANLSKEIYYRSELHEGINERWLGVLLQHPICFFYHKFNYTKYLIGANSGVQFLITHTTINENDYGYVMRESPLRDAVYSYIIKASEVFFLKPWFVYILSLAGFLYIARIGVITAGHFTIFISGVMYASSFVMFGNAADARLLFYTTAALSLIAFVSVVEFKARV